MRWLLILILFPIRLVAATGAVIGADVEASGWVLSLYIEGYSPAVPGYNRWSLGWSTNNGSSSAIVLTVSSPGFDSTGNATTVSRLVYGTKGLRDPWYSHTNESSVAIGSDVKARVALSDYIYSGDTITAMSISASVYSNNTAQSSFVPTNSSTASYPKTCGHWTWVPQQLWQGTTGRLRWFGINQTAADGKPVQCVKFVVTGVTSGTIVTQTVSALTIDQTLPDVIPTGEYVSDFDLTAFTNRELVRCDFVAFPKIGTTTEVLDTTTSTYQWPSWLPCAVTNRIDTNASYGAVTAVVDATVGSDANGRASFLTDPTAIDASIHFATIAIAANRCAASNNTYYSHNDLEGATIYVRNTVVNWVGGSSTYGNEPRTWCCIRNYPGETVTLTNQNGNLRLGVNALHWFKGISFDGPTSANLIYGSGAYASLWFDECKLQANPCSALWGAHKSTYFTYNTIANNAATILAGDNQPAVVRGNTLTNYAKTFGGFMMIGNQRIDTNGIAGTIRGDVAATLGLDYSVVYNNKFMGLKNTGGDTYTIGTSGTPSNGMAIVQNVFEFVANDAVAIQLGSSESYQYTNLFLVNNTILGEKLNFAYNDSGSTAKYRVSFGMRNNLIDDINIKQDVYTGANDTNRIGGWSVLYGVGCSGNVIAETVSVGANGIGFEFCGINCIGDNLLSGTSATGRSTNFLQFIDRLAYDGKTDDRPGNGNYRTHSVCPQTEIVTRWMLPYDIDGNARGELDPPGAYSSASPRKGAGFF